MFGWSAAWQSLTCSRCDFVDEQEDEVPALVDRRQDKGSQHHVRDLYILDDRSTMKRSFTAVGDEATYDDYTDNSQTVESEHRCYPHRFCMAFWSLPAIAGAIYLLLGPGPFLALSSVIFDNGLNFARHDGTREKPGSTHLPSDGAAAKGHGAIQMMKGNGSTATQSNMTSSSPRFHDCYAGYHDWTEDKKTWCCSHYGRGCARASASGTGTEGARSSMPATLGVTAGITAMQQKGSCASECMVAGMPAACGLRIWLAAREPQFAGHSAPCKMAHADVLRRCPTCANCSMKDANCLDIVDPRKEKRYDCSHGYSNWVMGWSSSQKAWCCQHEKKGCPSALAGERL